MMDPHSVVNVPRRDLYEVYEVPTAVIAHETGGVKRGHPLKGPVKSSLDSYSA
jgi:hypothetical protein